MDGQSSCAAVIPCLNEAPRIGRVVEETRRRVSRVVVVDDGSTDDTAARAQEAGAALIRHERSRGKGAALKTGLAAVWDEGCQMAIVLDGDGQHAPGDIPRFLERRAETGAELIVGNRMGDPAGMPRARRWVNRWMSRRISLWAGQEFPDTQCGFRLIDLAFWARLKFESDHYELESETIARFAEAGARICFVPIRAIYGDERSKIRPLRDSVRWALWWKNERAWRRAKR